MSDAGAPPQTIDAVPLKHPWRWVAAAVILIMAFLFIYGAATNQAYRWSVFAEYVFDKRVLTVGLVNTLQLTVYSMALAIALGVLLAVMRLSPNRCSAGCRGCTCGSSAAPRSTCSWCSGA